MKTRNIKIKILIILAILSSCLLFSCFIRSASATTARYAYNFDDITPEYAWKVNDNTYGDMENLAVYYNMGEGTCIIRGANYLYYCYGPGTGPYSVDLRFEGDSFWVGYVDSGIPNVGSPSWRTFRISGPTYLLDDDPYIRFIGTDPSDNCIALCGDTPSNGHSFYDIGSGWIVDPDCEYIVELIYEWVIVLNIDTVETGSITSTDNVDAYFITLTSGNDYEFELERTSGTGDINMRIVTYQDLTNDNLAQSSGTSYPKSMTYTPSSSGTYVLLVEADNAGVDIADYSINYFLDEQPVAEFTADQTTIMEGESVQFTFTGSAGNTPTTYEWDFGDGSPLSYDQNPLHQYDLAGTYTVSLTVTDNDDDTDVEIKPNYISVSEDLLPVAEFTADDMTIMEGESVQFTFTGSAGDIPTTYEWDFGDGSPLSYDQNPLHQYDLAGTYTVSLTVTDNDDDTDVEIKPNYISVAGDLLPVAEFTADDTAIMEGESVQFTFTGSAGDTPTTYEWDFGDGTPLSYDQNPLHQYDSAGTYTVSLTVTDNDDDTDVEIKPNYISVAEDLLPVAEFTADDTTINEGDSVQFIFTGSAGDIPTTYEWDFGDGSPLSYDQNPLHQYDLAGTYTVSLTVTDNDDDTDVEIKPNYISVAEDLLPIAEFTADDTTINEGESVQFTFTGSAGDTPTTYEWDFGDGTPLSYDQNPLHQYDSAGTYTVSLTVTDNDDDTDVEIKPNYISVAGDLSPVAEFTADDTTINEGDSVKFTFTGSAGDTPTTYEWDFGDGSPVSYDQNPLHQYDSAGTYTVSLTVIDNDDDTDVETKVNFITVSVPDDDDDGDDDDDDNDDDKAEENTMGGDAINFLLSPIGLITIGGITAAGVAVIIGVWFVKKRGKR